MNLRYSKWWRVHFQSECSSEELITRQFDHWQKPDIFADSLSFFQCLKATPVYILSNIDKDDIHHAVRYHNIEVDGQQMLEHNFAGQTLSRSYQSLME